MQSEQELWREIQQLKILVDELRSHGLTVGMRNTAVIGGDFGGNARGDLALDIQTNRTNVNQVASGEEAVALGTRCMAATDDSVGVGHYCRVEPGGSGGVALGHYCHVLTGTGVAVGDVADASGDESVAVGKNVIAAGLQGTSIGRGADSDGEKAVAVGYNSYAGGYGSAALGYRARARIARTTNLTGPIIVRRDETPGGNDDAGAEFESFCGAEIIILTTEVDLKVVANQTISIPTGAHFWFNELGIICTAINTMTVQPTIQFGDDVANNNQVVAVLTTQMNVVRKRETFVPLDPIVAHTALVAGVTVGATATQLLGRFYFKGILVEDE